MRTLVMIYFLFIYFCSLLGGETLKVRTRRPPCTVWVTMRCAAVPRLDTAWRRLCVAVCFIPFFFFLLPSPLFVSLLTLITLHKGRRMSVQPHLRKLRKLKRANPSPDEDSVAKVLFELEATHKTLRTQLPRFHINTVRTLTSPRFRKTAMIVLYPLRFLMLVRKIQRTLTAELEKRFPGSVVALVAQRKIAKRPNDVYKLQKVQRSRTSVAVFENILNDLIYPCDVVGRRWRCRTDGSKVMKVFLDSRDRKRVESRLPLIAHIYKQLTHRAVSFGFMWNSKLQQVSSR
ncbi:small subunit ribosomal protein S7e [Trypanosoma rangeli SC58]|uniref:40S ribosomal protein S7 n=2 Tax=Trypanosoma rangeli SC58 TaxID=429131 RepID=A0A061J190_TRYRA|nr:small subunit ribosomal protein S7e [Trypanosoma rangeli SC58]